MHQRHHQQGYHKADALIANSKIKDFIHPVILRMMIFSKGFVG
jgi:hypothetical protein